MTPVQLPSLGTPPVVDTLAFVEAFGPTIQGEGPQSGRACSFVRFGACNLSCSWCDSAYTWDTHRFNLREEVTQLSLDALTERIPTGAPMLVITGGEPLLQQTRKAWPSFLQWAADNFEFIAVETNGTILPLPVTQRYVHQFVVSPKLPTVDMLRPAHREPAQGWHHVHGVDVKVVVSERSDVPLALAIAEGMGVDRSHTWIMPEGTTTQALAEKWPWVCDLAAQHGINASHRLHVLSWGDDRGH